VKSWIYDEEDDPLLQVAENGYNPVIMDDDIINVSSVTQSMISKSAVPFLKDIRDPQIGDVCYEICSHASYFYDGQNWNKVESEIWVNI